jgi:hypothetical protein
MKLIKAITIIILLFLSLYILVNIVIDVNFKRNYDIQYKQLCQLVDMNCEYYTDFSKTFINLFDKHKLTDFEKNTLLGKYPFLILYNQQEPELRKEFENVLNTNLIVEGYLRYVKTEDAHIRYVCLETRYGLTKRSFSIGHISDYSIDFYIIYIPDEYLNDSNLKTILGDDYESLYRKENLFIIEESFAFI